jgi:hypothetical protein
MGLADVHSMSGPDLSQPSRLAANHEVRAPINAQALWNQCWIFRPFFSPKAYTLSSNEPT